MSLLERGQFPIEKAVMLKSGNGHMYMIAGGLRKPTSTCSDHENT